MRPAASRRERGDGGCGHEHSTRVPATPRAPVPDAHAPTAGVSLVDRPARGTLGFRHVRAIHDHARTLERDQTSTDHLIEVRKNCLNALFGLDALDDDRQVERELEKPIGANVTARTEAHDRPVYGRSRIML